MSSNVSIAVRPHIQGTTNVGASWVYSQDLFGRTTGHADVVFGHVSVEEL